MAKPAGGADANRMNRPLAPGRKAAEQAYADAQYNLGVMYANGRSVAQDDAEAMRWLRKAAEQEYALAQDHLGCMYANGRGVPQDDTEAMRWFRKAAEQARADAQYNLGFMYANGRGVPQDYLQAHMWFNLAAVRFPASETKAREEAIRNRDRVAAKMTAEQIAEAQRLAREWKPK
jgi:TPR repeat protein